MTSPHWLQSNIYAKRDDPARHGALWNRIEETDFLKGVAQGKDLDTIAAFHQRSRGALRSALRRVNPLFGVGRRRKPLIYFANGRWNCSAKHTAALVVGHGASPLAAWADMVLAWRFIEESSHA